MNKIGIAACVGLFEESRIFAKILTKHNFEVYFVACKVGAMKKTEITGLDESKTKVTGNVMCNPILQAKILNDEKTDLNVIIVFPDNSYNHHNMQHMLHFIIMVLGIYIKFCNICCIMSWNI